MALCSGVCTSRCKPFYFWQIATVGVGRRDLRQPWPTVVADQLLSRTAAWDSLSRCLTGLLSAAGVRARHARQKRAAVAARSVMSSDVVILLVDADSHSLEEIQGGISLLSKEYSAVRTSIFAAPGREENKKWRRFFQEPDIDFQPVSRRGPQDGGEANDTAIIAEMRRLAMSKSAGCVALLVSDKDFADPVADVAGCGQNVVMLVPSCKSTVRRTYEEVGVPVVELLRSRSGAKVRAMLSEDGSGSVTLAEPFVSRDSDEEVQLGLREPITKHVSSFLQDLGYCDGTGYLLPAIVNFWFTNALGPLTVFPRQCATLALYDCVRNAATKRDWQKHQAALAFFLPKSATRKLSKAKRHEFGNGIAQEIFQGGGPFVQRDSGELVVQALQRMGYLDANHNNDFSEAIMLFVNTNHNKRTLRKMGALPASGTSAADAADMLRTVFLSRNSTGLWQTAPRSRQVRLLLCKEGLLDNVASPEPKVLKAMSKYMRIHGLPSMKTFNGCVWRMLYHCGTSQNPDYTGTVVFDN